MGLGTWYALPGGRQRYGETLSETLHRECREELGAEVTVGQLLFVREYIHDRHELRGTGRDQHKVEFMFACDLVSPLSHATGIDVDQVGVEWVPLDAMASLKVFPSSLSNLGMLLNDTRPDNIYWGENY